MGGDSGRSAEGWLELDDKWYYFESDGKAATGWLSDGGDWYYLDPTDCYVVTGDVTVDGVRYRFRSTGKLAPSGSWVTNGIGAMANNGVYYDEVYYVENGERLTGWQQLDGDWYYFNESDGVMARYQKLGEYCVGGDGAMLTNAWFEWHDHSYTLGGNEYGLAIQDRGSIWYYCGPDGKVVTGTYTIKGKLHSFDSDGVWLEQLTPDGTGM